MMFDTAMRLAGFDNQKALADMLGTDHGTVNRWRCGRRPVPHAVAIILELLRDPRRKLKADYVAELVREAWRRGMS
jgi:hypothetical protein